MFGFTSRSRSKSRVAARPVRLSLERLEGRDCPSLSGPAITGLIASILPGHIATLAGTVTDPNPASVTITFSGKASGSTTADSTGHFSFSTTNASLGQVSAIGVDCRNKTSNTATANITDTAPTLTLNLTYGSQKSVTLSGKVTDIDAGGRTVQLTGVVNATVTTAADGTFTFTTTATGLGTVQGSTTDLWLQTSNTPQVTVSCPPPQISTFTASQGDNNMWTFSGNVNAQSPAGLIITFGGLPELVGKTAAVAADGTFSITVQLQPGEIGTATAQTVDWWGQNSNQATDLV
jgi:hypothetical protein